MISPGLGIKGAQIALTNNPTGQLLAQDLASAQGH